MSKELSELRESGQEIPRLQEEAQHILSFLQRDREVAYSFREIVEGVYPPRESEVFFPYAPVWAVMRDFSLGATLDTLLRTGQVRQIREGTEIWYHLSS